MPDEQPRLPSYDAVVCFSCDEAYAPFFSVALRSVIETRDPAKSYRIVWLSDGVSDFVKGLIRGMADAPGVTLDIIECSEMLDRFAFQLHTERLSRSTFTRFFTLDLLAGCDKAVYLDVDVVCRSDVAELYATDVSGYDLAAVADERLMQRLRRDEKLSRYVRQELGRSDPYFNAGVLVLNLKRLRERFTSQGLARMAVEKRYRWEDQDVLNSLTDGSTLFLDPAWNMFLAPEEAGEDEAWQRAVRQPRLIHYSNRKDPVNCDDGRWQDIFWLMAARTPFHSALLEKKQRRLAVGSGLGRLAMRCRRLLKKLRRR
ncbi:MAG: glycosyltransferase family 8 protein [Duodenibacillus sp.]|nr:glycosyltransferase family 8 protein [Duodenibacillus sp.]